MNKVEKYTKMETFTPQIISTVCIGASMLCKWVLYVED